MFLTVTRLQKYKSRERCASVPLQVMDGTVFSPGDRMSLSRLLIISSAQNYNNCFLKQA